MMRSKVQHLYEIMQSNPLDRKVLIVSSHAQGQQWLGQVSRQYGSVLNTEVRTLEAWVLEGSKLLLAKRKLRYLSSAESKWIACRLLQETSRSGNDYLTGIALTPGLTDAFHQALIELRESGVRAEKLVPEHFEQAAKGAFIKQLLTRYENWLEDNSLVDLAGLADEIGQLPPSADSVILDQTAVRSSVDKRLIEKRTAGDYILLSNDPEFTAPASSFPFETSEFFHATGAIAEVREVIRHIVERSIPLDQIEIIASDSAKNAAAVYTAAAAGGIPCTFEGGLPIGVTNAGKAAKLYVEWLESGFHLSPILTALRQEVIHLRDDRAGAAPTARLIRELEQTGIGWGRERYGMLEKLSAAEGIPEERAVVLQGLQRVFARLIQPLDDQVLSTPEKLIHELISFLETCAECKEESDYELINGLRSLERSMRAAGGFTMNGDLALRYVREGLEGLRVQAAAVPLPGHIHVTSLNSGGQTGRPHIFIIGMSEASWSPSFRQDPVLLDEERARIRSELLISSALTKQRTEDRNRRIGMIRGRCTMSYCSYELSGQREHMPAYELLQVFRRKTNQANADYELLHHAMGNAVRYFHSAPGAAADTMEGWMRTLLAGSSALRSAKRIFYSSYPLLKEGARAVQARSEAGLSAFDGIVETDRYPVRLPGEPGGSSAFSASMLERYGRCPLQYFYQYTLGVWVKETAVYDRTKWLDANQRGSLLHDIFDRYLMSVKDSRQRGDASEHHDAKRICKIADETILQYAEKIPAPSEHIFRKEAVSIRKDVDVFFAGELQRTSMPIFTELQLHRDGAPLRLRINDDWSLPIKGFVDRVDETTPHRYKIYDYKTGNPLKYKQNECFSGGTQLQLPLYGLAVEQWMRQSGFDKEAQVMESAYVFPTERGMGEEISRPQNRREDLAAILQAMTESMKQGLFPPANDPKGCAWCDYNAVCGSHAEQFAYKRDASENAARLERILEVDDFA